MDEPAQYEIRVGQRLDEQWTKWFGDWKVVQSGDADETILEGEILDYSALFGVLGKIRDLGLTLVSVQCLKRPDSCPHVPKTALNSNDTSEEGR